MKLFRAIALIVFAAAAAFGQSTQGPDCVFRFSFTGSNQNSATFTNFTNTTGQACAYWLLTYATNGTVNTVSLVLQSAPAGATPTTAGTFVTYAGTAIAGAITNTSTTGASAFLWNSTTSDPFLRLHSTTLSCTGSCLLYGVLQGWNEGNAAGAAAAAAGGTGCPNPCPVIGVAADGAPVSGAPVRVGGKDGAGNTEDIITDTSGRLDPAGAATAQSDGASNTPTVPTANGAAATNINYAYVFNGATWDRQFYATLQAASSVAAGTDVVIATGTAAKITRLVHFDFIWDTSAAVTIRQGSGTTCGTSTATIAGPYPAGATIGLVMDYSTGGALTTTATGLDICLHFGASVTGGGFAKYQQF